MTKVLWKYICVVGLFMFLSCEEDKDVVSIFLGKQYFPVNLNAEWVYQIDSIHYDDFSQTIDTFSFHRKLQVVEVTEDLEKRTAFRLAVLERADDSSLWKQKRFIRWTVTDRRIEQLKNNLITIPMIFPVVENDEWDANALNSDQEQSFQFRSLHQRANVEGISYDSVLTISQFEEENKIERINVSERYATNVGMIARDDLRLNTELNGEIRNGHDVKYRLISYK